MRLGILSDICWASGAVGMLTCMAIADRIAHGIAARG
jgi:hypothetical protein